MSSDMMMGYSKIGRRSWNRGGSKGFRLNPKRFTVQRLRSRFVYLFRLLRRWKSSYGDAVQSLKRGMKRNNSSSSSRTNLVVHDCRIRTFGRSNSFYSEAIADCLEFIKRSS